MKLWKKVLFIFIGLLFLLTASFVIWGETPAQPMPQALAALNNDGIVSVQQGRWLVFTPVGTIANTALIFYPGGRVDYRAYAVMAHKLAEKGYLVVIPRMPLNLAVFGIDEASKIVEAYPQFQHWYIAGHSLGGSMAAAYLFKHPDQFDGLILLASYPAENNDLSNYQGRVLSLSGSLDGLATPEKIDATKSLLPADTQYLVIQGGDHAYFGYYGPQSGDNPATITREQQQATVLNTIAEFMK